MHQVMLVDDYEIFRKQLKRQKCWKEQSRFVLAGEADNGLDALIALRKRPVDILVTDIKMPQLNGLELLERVRNEGLCKCVILLSEYADFEYARRGIVLGAFDYIVKPVKGGSFFNVLNRAADYISRTSQEEDQMFYERASAVKCILNGSEHFEKVVAGLLKKCSEIVHHDFVKNGVLLAETERKIYDALAEKMKWLSLMVSDIDHICDKIIQSDSTYTMSAIFEEFLREMYASVKTYYPSKMSALSKKVVDYVLEHPFEKLTLTTTAENCFVSKAYLSHSFKSDMDRSFVEYVSCLKMQIIKKMLIETDLSMAEIAEKLNYEDSKYMGRLFKNTFGMTPTDYKKCRALSTQKSHP